VRDVSREVREGSQGWDFKNVQIKANGMMGKMASLGVSVPTLRQGMSFNLGIAASRELRGESQGWDFENVQIKANDMMGNMASLGPLEATIRDRNLPNGLPVLMFSNPKRVGATTRPHRFAVQSE
jgi:hypothetical protein